MAEQGTGKSDEASPTTIHKRQKGRSPSYPGIDLEKALDLARVVYEKEGRHDTPVEAVWTDWGMRPKTGPALVSVAALKKFGLLDGTSGKVRLSTLALDILLDERENSTERAERIREAALKPSIHTELWERYQGKLPTSDAALRLYLVRDRKFTDSGADELIRQFRRTIGFSKLTESPLPSDKLGDKLNGEEGNQVGARTGDMQPPPSPPPGGSGAVMREVQIPLPGVPWPTIKAMIPFTRETWEKFKNMLDAMEEGLVEAPKTPDEDQKKDAQ
jgi:hypothetical protein